MSLLTRYDGGWSDVLAALDRVSNPLPGLIRQAREGVEALAEAAGADLAGPQYDPARDYARRLDELLTEIETVATGG